MAVASLSGYAPRRRYDQNPWTGARLDGRLADGTWTEIDSYTFDVPDPDPSEPAPRNFTTENVDASTMTDLRIAFLDDDGDQDITDPIPLNPAGTLATLAAVKTRLSVDMTDRDLAQAALFIEQATTGIYAALGRDPVTWTPPTAIGLDLMRMMCVEIASRVMVNPSDLQRRRETIGAYSYDEMFAARSSVAPGLYPTPTEELLLRRTVYGANTASMKVRSMADEYAELTWAQAEISWALYYGPVNNPQIWA